MSERVRAYRTKHPQQRTWASSNLTAERAEAKSTSASNSNTNSSAASSAPASSAAAPATALPAKNPEEIDLDMADADTDTSSSASSSATAATNGHSHAGSSASTASSDSSDAASSDAGLLEAIQARRAELARLQAQQLQEQKLREIPPDPFDVPLNFSLTAPAYVFHPSVPLNRDAPQPGLSRCWSCELLICVACGRFHDQSADGRTVGHARLARSLHTSVFTRSAATATAAAAATWRVLESRSRHRVWILCARARRVGWLFRARGRSGRRWQCIELERSRIKRSN